MIIIKANSEHGIARIVHNFLHTIPLLWRISPILLVISSLLYLIEALIPLATIYVMKEMVDTIVNIFQGKENFLQGFILLSIQVGVSLFSLIIAQVHYLLNIKMKQAVDFFFEHQILSKTTVLPLVFFDVPESYDKLLRAKNVSGNGLSLFNNSLEIIKNIITLISYIIILMRFHWGLPILMMILIVPALFVEMKYGNKKYKQMFDQTPTVRRVNYLSDILKDRGVAKELRVFNHGLFLMNKWKNLFWKNENEQYTLEKSATKANLTIVGVSQLSIAFFSGFLLWVAIKGRMSVGGFLSLSQVVSSSIYLINNISNKLGQLHSDSVYMTDYFEFMSLEEEVIMEGNTNDFYFHDCYEQISFENVSFSYPGNKKKVLDSISFGINKGEKIAIVGENGAGKSTLVKCLMGLYKPTEGTVYYQGIDINMIEPIKLRERFSAIFQDFSHYQLTFRENIGISHTELIGDSKAINTVANIVGLNETITSFRNGIDTELGASFNEGQELSGGQWQKIALSRLLFKNSDIIILDEPTSAMDPISEAKLLEKFLEITNKKTAIFITHRLGICTKVDRILVLKNGVLVEEGSHTELMNKGGEYERFFSSQAQWYVS